MRSVLFEIKYLLIFEILLLSVFAIFDFVTFLSLSIGLFIIPFFFLIFKYPIFGVHLLVYSILAGSIGVAKLGGKAPIILYVDLVLFFLCVLAFIKILLEYDLLSIKVEKINLYFLVFLFWSLVIVLIAINKPRALFVWKSYFAGFFVFTYLMFFLKDGKNVRWLLYSIILWGLVLSIIQFKILLDIGGFSTGILGLFLKKNLLATSWGRSNYLATFFVLIIPITIGLLIYVTELKKRIFLFISLVVMSSAMLLTLSRGGLIALFSALIIFLAKATKPRTFIPILLVFIALILVIVLNPLGTVIMERISSFERSASYFTRVNFYEDVWKTFLNYPITGVGLGNLGYYAQFVISSQASAHNIILGMLGEIGLIGAGLFMLLILKFFKDVVSKFKNEKVDELKILRWAFISSFVGGGVHSLMEPNFEGVQFSIIFWVCAGIYYKLNFLVDKKFSP